MKKSNSHYLFLIYIGICCACNPPKHKEPVAQSISLKSIIVLNEGGYTYNNAEISLIDVDSNKVANDLYKQNNQGKELGDVLQSMERFDHNYYWVLNNSNKIVVTDTSFQELYVMNGFNSPRYIHIVNSEKAYVSDLYDNRIAIVNLGEKKISSYISCKAGTEKFLKEVSTNNLWVSNSYSDQIYKIDTDKDQIIDSLTTPYGPLDLLYDKNTHVWVSCSGQKDKNIPSALLCIDLSTKSILKKIEAGNNGYFSEAHLCINASKDTLYWTALGGIYKMSITADSYPEQNFIEAKGRIFYGLNVHPYSHEIYVTDAVDYSQNGYVLRYSRTGKLIASFKVGKIPNSIFFR